MSAQPTIAANVKECLPHMEGREHRAAGYENSSLDLLVRHRCRSLILQHKSRGAKAAFSKRDITEGLD